MTNIRNRMRHAALLALALLALPAPASSQQRGGVLDFGIVAEPPTYDCHAGNTYAVMNAVAPHYSTLLKIDLKNYPAIIGDLAASWQVSPDGRTYAFKLKPDVKFHDGTTLSSADVVASWERLRNPPPGVVSVRKALFEDIERIEAPDPATVVFTLRAANSVMPTIFAMPWNCIYAAAKLAQDPTFPVKTILGTGPFRFVEHVKGSHWVGQRFDSYHVAGLPYLDGFRATFITNPSALVNALQGGAIKAEFRGLTPNDRDRLVQTLGPKIRIEEGSEPTVLLIVFNAQKKPFDDPRVRRALSLGLDRWTASDGLGRQSRARWPGGIVRPGSDFAAPESELVKYPGMGRDAEAARAEARRLLKEAGQESLSLVLTNRNFAPYTQVGIFAVDQWRRIGVTAEHRPLETAQWTQALASGSFDAAADFGTAELDDPSLLLTKYLSSDRSPSNASKAIDRELDSLYERQHRAGNFAERLAAVRLFEARVFEQAYAVPVLWAQRIIATSADLRGWDMGPSAVLGQDLAAVWLER